MAIEIGSNAWVMQLLEAIEVELHSRGRTDVRVDNLRLFKQADVPTEPKESRQSRALRWLHEQPADSQLDEMKKLSSIFPNGPRGSDDKLDIIIADAEEMVDALSDPHVAYNKKVKNALNECLDTHLSLPSPSEVVKDARMLDKVFGGKEPRIHVGRPGGAPAVIFHPVLAALQQNLDYLEQVEVSPAEVSRAANYLHSAAKFYEDKDQRQDVIKDLITDALGGTGKWKHTINLDSGSTVRVKGEKIIPDASWWHNVFLILVLELKNSLGLYGDALFQAVVDYSKMVAGDEYRPFREYSNFPIVLIGATANRLEIAVAVFAGSTYVTKLRTFDFSLGFHASDNIIRLARLPTSYTLLYISQPDTPRSFHDITYRQFLSRAGQPTLDLVDLGDATTAMYIAILDDQEVIVKFTTRYNEAAHRLLADTQLAPRLHFCGRVVGDLYMIVMDRVDGMSVWQLQEDNMPIPQIVPTQVEEAVRLLHEQDIVFGDLRANNILYVLSGAEERVVLVDFDWPAKDGEGRYPATLNPGTTWHKEVAPYSIMRKTHDLWQLARLRGLCTQSNIL
ncbi:hypothetical protein H0H81_006764 [Sphagnurus paluster]|uniref:Protein kinase domain-containing protein n=1 Tax=Sphagnurus paluster TaxID=117069 RepID=A0A9P7FXC3_9AGAR|nr:hypothetical protein H0H81_006764 [Sphagnurus paluster]